MKEKSLIQIFIRYIKEHRKLLCCYVICFGILLWISFLYDNYMEGVLYGMCLSNILLFIVGGYDFLQYVKKHRALQAYANEVRDSLEHLIVDSSLIGQDYQYLLQEL